MEALVERQMASDGVSEGMSLSAAAMGELLAGEYIDVKHPGCPRTITFADPASPEAFVIDGHDGDQDGEGGLWTCTGTLNPDNTMVVDLSAKGGPSSLEGEWTGSTLRLASEQPLPLPHTLPAHSTLRPQALLVALLLDA
eukprot:SAG31_NODE_11794_length_997_cov_1.743875_1_plen_140_part_00